MTRTAAPLFALRASWRRRGLSYDVPEPPAIAGIEAQALEYAEVMGEDALRRQWAGTDRLRRRIEKRLLTLRARAGR